MGIHRHILIPCILPVLFFVLTASGQVQFLRKPGLNAADTSPLPPSNSISHLVNRGTVLWAGTGNGLARTTDGGHTWQSFGNLAQFANKGIFALDVKGDTVWASTGYSKDVDGQSVQTGSGFAYSLDNGTTWTGLPQPLDAANDSVVMYGANRVHFLPITVPEQNVTFDLAITDSTVWIASWSSGLRRSTDKGQTWQRVVLPSQNRNSISPTDSLGSYSVDPRPDNNFKMFSVMAENNTTIWAGSAGGINKSTDGGISWTKFTKTNQDSSISGDWVIALRAQRLGAGTRVWATNWPGDGPNQGYGVSYTDNGGLSWKNVLPGVKAYAFAFRDSIAYVASDDGMYRTIDGGATWIRSGTVADPSSGFRLTSTVFFAVAVIGDTVYGGTSEGLAKTVDSPTSQFGQDWQIVKTYIPSGGTGNTYAYPNPFAPQLESVRIHYSTGGSASMVTVEVFDFGMNRVRTIVKDASRSGEQEEIWDGRGDGGSTVPNGVYFYRVIIGGGTPAWGKIMVLQ